MTIDINRPKNKTSYFKLQTENKIEKVNRIMFSKLVYVKSNMNMKNDIFNNIVIFLL